MSHTTPQNTIIQTDLEAELRRLSANLDDRSRELADLAVKAAHAEVAYKQKRAVAILKASGTVSEKDAAATLETVAEYRERLVADALRDACVETCRNLRSQLSALQSINANVRAMVS
jgi:hypothetical protein